MTAKQFRSGRASRHYTDQQDFGLVFHRHGNDVVVDWDVPIVVADGTTLYANVYRPRAAGRYPVLATVTGYGKSLFNSWQAFRQFPRFHMGSISISDLVTFEAPDPDFWVPSGYVVVSADARGQGRSEGEQGYNAPQDFADIIQWAGGREWSNGNVGALGVSALAMIQYTAAALQPSHLKAIAPWEGVINRWRRFGGVPETAFLNWVFTAQVVPAHNPGFGYHGRDAAGNLLDPPSNHPLYDAYWEAQRAPLEKITQPALICASSSDQGLHTPGSFEVYSGIRSAHKWLFHHRRPKWEAFYAEANGIQKKFFDHFLKGEDNGLMDLPRVHVEVNEDRRSYTVREATSWPLEGTEYVELYLDARTRSLAPKPVESESVASYRSAMVEGGSEQAIFDYTFDRDTDLVGTSGLRLFVSASEADDMDLFVGIRKFDAAGDEVFFYGYSGSNPNDIVARGWLRVSHRKLDPVMSTPWRPYQNHDSEQKIKPGEMVEVEIEILPYAVTFRAGETLRVVIQGAPIEPDSAQIEFAPANRGLHFIHTGARYGSRLLVPVLPRP